MTPTPTLDIFNIFLYFFAKIWKSVFNQFYRYLRFMAFLLIPISRKQIPPKSKKIPKLWFFGISMTKIPKFGKILGFSPRSIRLVPPMSTKSKNPSKVGFERFDRGGLVWSPPPLLTFSIFFVTFFQKFENRFFTTSIVTYVSWRFFWYPYLEKNCPKIQKNPKITIFWDFEDKNLQIWGNFGFFTQIHKIGATYVK